MRHSFSKYALISGLILSLAVVIVYRRIFVQPEVVLSIKDLPAPNHSLWTLELQKYVDEDGWVNYAAWQQDQQGLNDYLAILATQLPAESWTREEQLAYWINAYNAFTVKLILDHYPLHSIEELHGIPYVNTVFHKEWFELGGMAMSLNRIEHGVLRQQFQEPRIHAAINCASVSCPPLQSVAFLPETMDQQLEIVMRSFVNDPLRNRLSPEEVEISSIFRWFRGDFTQNGNIISFLNQYVDVPISPDADVRYLTYDWNLNEVRR